MRGRYDKLDLPLVQEAHRYARVRVAEEEPDSLVSVQADV
jgi:hypothetical protein